MAKLSDYNARIWRQLNEQMHGVHGVDGCLLWQGYVTPTGTPVFEYEGLYADARKVWAQIKGNQKALNPFGPASPSYAQGGRLRLDWLLLPGLDDTGYPCEPLCFNHMVYMDPAVRPKYEQVLAQRRDYWLGMDYEARKEEIQYGPRVQLYSGEMFAVMEAGWNGSGFDGLLMTEAAPSMSSKSLRS